jgi:hypothetical protein
MAPLLMSATGVGYEQHAYVWTGFGAWTQLWASWTLPLAWGWTWRAIRDGRGYLAAIFRGSGGDVGLLGDYWFAAVGDSASLIWMIFCMVVVAPAALFRAGPSPGK